MKKPCQHIYNTRDICHYCGEKKPERSKFDLLQHLSIYNVLKEKYGVKTD
jgi:hypothetical protein